MGLQNPLREKLFGEKQIHSPPGAKVEEGSFLVSFGHITMLRVEASEMDLKSYSCRAVF